MGRWFDQLGRYLVDIRQRVVDRLQLFRVALYQCFRLARLDHAPFRQRIRPQLACRGVFAHGFVQPRLRKAGFVPLVVAVAPVADQVDQEVLFKFLLVGKGDARHLDAGRRVVGIDVDDRHLEALGQIAGVQRAASFIGFRRKAELVVGDDVHGAAGPVPRQLRKVKRLRHHALAGEGSVAVDQDRQCELGIEHGRSPPVRARARRTGHADRNRVDQFQVAGVGRHSHDQGLLRLAVCLLRVDDAAAAAMVLDVARSPADVVPQLLDLERVFELRQDLLVGQVQVVRQHVEPPAVRHADQDIGRAGLGGDTISSSSIGTSMSSPSIEKRYLPGKARCRNCSKTSTCVMRSSRLFR